jgi:drug/metabolite transporter (DMT)-like permease
MTYDFLRLPILALLGVIVFNEPLNSAMMLGGLCILIACWINFQPAKPAPARPTENSNPTSHGL